MDEFESLSIEFCPHFARKNSWPSNLHYFFPISRCRAKFLNVMHILIGLTSTSRTGSVYVTIAVTIERYFAIVKPTNQFKMKIILLPIAITFAILYNFPKVRLKGANTDWLKFLIIRFEILWQFFEIEARDRYDEGLGKNFTELCKTSIGMNAYYKTVYVFWSKVIFMEMIPYIVIISLNSCIISSILKSNKVIYICSKILELQNKSHYFTYRPFMSDF